MQDLKLFNTNITMSSLEIANLTGKDHDKVMRSIKATLEHLGLEAIDYKNFYLDKYNRKQTCYIIPKKISDLLLDKYKGLNRVPHRLQEEAALKTIEQLLGITLIRQYQCNGYRLDGYDAINNVVYEIDEPEHKYKETKDLERQEEIENLLKCKFVRIKL